MKKVLLNLINIDINIFRLFFFRIIKYFFIILSLFLSSCESFESPSWKTQVNLPLLDEQYLFSQIIESEGIIEDEDNLVALEFENTMFDGLGIPPEYFITSSLSFSVPAVSLDDLIGVSDISELLPPISINESINIDFSDLTEPLGSYDIVEECVVEYESESYQIIEGCSINISELFNNDNCIPQEIVENLNLSFDPIVFGIPVSSLYGEDALFSEYDYLTIDDAIFTCDGCDVITENLFFPIDVNYSMEGYNGDILFTEEISNISTAKNIKDEINFSYSVLFDNQNPIPDCTGEFDLILSRELDEFECAFLGQDYPCDLEIAYTHEYQGWQYEKEENYAINFSADMEINNIYSITGKTNEFTISQEDSFPIDNDGLDILEGQISNDTYNDNYPELNKLDFSIQNSSQIIPLSLSLELLNFIDGSEVLDITDFTIQPNESVYKEKYFNGTQIVHYPIVDDGNYQVIDQIYMNLNINYPSYPEQGTKEFVINNSFDNLLGFSISDVSIAPIKFDAIETVVHDFIIDVPSLSLSSVPYGIEGLEFVNPILTINLDNQIRIDNTLTFYLQSFLENEIISELALNIILNIPDAPDESANTSITIEGDSYTVSYDDIEQYSELLQNGSGNSITLPEFLKNTSDELRVSGQASLNGTGYLEPGDQATISGDFELNVPFSIIVGEYIEPDTYTDINMFPSNPTYLAPFDNSTKESIDNSLYEASISSYIENNSIFVGSLSIIVSTDENYFPLNFDDLGNVSGISNCTSLCIIDETSDTFHNLLEFLKVPSDGNPEIFEVVETNIGLLNEENIISIEYTPMSDSDSTPKLIKLVSENDFLLIGRLTTLDLPYPIIDEDGNIQSPGYISYEEPMIIDEEQIELINYTSEQKDRYINPLIKLVNSNYINANNIPENDGGIVNILTTHYIEIQSYMSFVITPGDY